MEGESNLLDVIGGVIDLELDDVKKFNFYICPCYINKSNPRIIQLLSKFDIQDFKNSMQFIDGFYFCKRCFKHSLYFSEESDETYITEIKALIKKAPEMFFSNIPILRISPIEFLNNLIDNANEECDEVYKYKIKCLQKRLCFYLIDILSDISKYANQEIKRIKLKNTAFNFISTTTDDFLLKLPMDIWNIIFEFV